MDKIDRNSSFSGGVTFGECNVRRLLFADDLALLSSNESNLQHALDRFSDACLDAGIKINMAKTEIMCLYLGLFWLLFVSWLLCLSRTTNWTTNCIGKASAVMRQLCRLVVAKRELCTKEKLSVFRSIYVPILTYGHECWVMTERVQGAEMSFLQKVRSLSLCDMVKSPDICQFFNIKPLHLRIEKSQLHWYGHVTRMSHERSAKQLMDAFSSCKRLRGRLRSRWPDYDENLAWSCVGIPLAESPLVAKDWDAWRSQLKLLPTQLQKDTRKKRNTLNQFNVFPKNDDDDVL